MIRTVTFCAFTTQARIAAIHRGGFRMLRLRRARRILFSLSSGAPFMSRSDKTISVTVELPAAEAWNLAQFLKRSTFSDYRGNAQDDDEAYAMIHAADRVRVALADAGYAPR